MEGNPLALRERSAALGIRSSSAIYEAAILAEFPDITIDTVMAADPGPCLPPDRDFADYDGIVVGGSSLHAYDSDFAVTNQIDMLRAACEAGLPALGSCWGLQIACVAAGGRVERSPNGREIGVARKIATTAAGAAHPFMAGNGPVFDAPCIHYDEVAELPAGAVLLASNAHSLVQAAVVPLGRSELWGVQYHPEFDLAVIAGLLRLYAKDMLDQGFFRHADEQAAYQHAIEALDARPHDRALRWQLGIDDDVLDHGRRRAPIIAWIQHIRSHPR
jgi:GMP synthase (glutamine-hydrolysing)